MVLPGPTPLWHWAAKYYWSAILHKGHRVSCHLVGLPNRDPYAPVCSRISGLCIWNPSICRSLWNKPNWNPSHHVYLLIQCLLPSHITWESSYSPFLMLSFLPEDTKLINISWALPVVHRSCPNLLNKQWSQLRLRKDYTSKKVFGHRSKEINTIFSCSPFQSQHV